MVSVNQEVDTFATSYFNKIRYRFTLKETATPLVAVFSPKVEKIEGIENWFFKKGEEVSLSVPISLTLLKAKDTKDDSEPFFRIIMPFLTLFGSIFGA